MPKPKPERRSHISNAIATLEVEHKDIKKKTILIEMIEIKNIYELTLKNDILMHNRISYSKIKLMELAANIAELASENAGIMGTGILNPIMVRRNNNRLERIHGDNRIKALLLNKKDSVPVIILDNISDELARFMRSSENLNREDLNPYDETLSILEHIQLACKFAGLEEVKSFINKIKNFKAGKTSLNEQEKILYKDVGEIFKKIGRFDIITFVDRLAILRLNILIKQALVDEYINYSQAKIINTKLKNENDIVKIIDMLKIKNMSKKDLNIYLTNLNSNKIKENKPTFKIKLQNDRVVLNSDFSKLTDIEKSNLCKELENVIKKYSSKENRAINI